MDFALHPRSSNWQSSLIVLQLLLECILKKMGVKQNSSNGILLQVGNAQIESNDTTTNVNVEKWDVAAKG